MRKSFLIVDQILVLKISNISLKSMKNNCSDGESKRDNIVFCSAHTVVETC